MSLLARVPVDLGREEAQRLARQELAKPDYQRHRPGLLRRLLQEMFERLGDLLSRTQGASPSKWFALLLLAVIGVVVIVALRRRVRPGRRSTTPELFTGRPLTAAEHRAAADSAAGRGAWADAVRERLRAIVRDLEERGVLEPRPGRTADEAARDGGAALPAVAAPLSAGARLFDDIWYGGRAATEAHDRALREADAVVRAARPSLTLR